MPVLPAKGGFSRPSLYPHFGISPMPFFPLDKEGFDSVNTARRACGFHFQGLYVYFLRWYSLSSALYGDSFVLSQPLQCFYTSSINNHRLACHIGVSTGT